MHPLLKTLLVAVLVGGVGFAGIYYYKQSTTRTEYHQRMDALEQEWTARLGSVQSITDSARYQEEMGHLLKWYFSQLQAIHNRFPTLSDPDAGWKSIEKRVKSGHIPKDRVAQYKEFYGYAKKAYTTLQSGDYQPSPSGSAASMHMDIYSMKPVTYKGVPRIRIDFALWGAPHRIEKNTDGAGVVHKKITVPIRFSKMFFQFIGADGKVYGEMTGSSGEPTIKIEDPTHWIPGFPPGAVLGTWWVDPFPDQAAKAVWELELTGRTDAGNPIDAHYKWDLDVPDAWKSATWQKGAAEQVRDKDYIDHPADGTAAAAAAGAGH